MSNVAKKILQQPAWTSYISILIVQ